MAVLEHAKTFFHAHPIESALLGGVGFIALYLAFKPKPSGNSQEAALQNAYFQAESIQAQSGAAVQIATIGASRDASLAATAADVSKSNALVYANLDETINAANNNAAVAALPYAEQSHFIDALTAISSQSQTTKKSSNGFFGLGASSKDITTPTPAATSAAAYLEELSHGLYAAH